MLGDDDIPEQIFRKDGRPICFTIHKSIRNKDNQTKLLNDIESHGGKVLDDDNGVDIVLFNHRRSEWKQHEFQNAYNTHPDVAKRKIWVHPMTYVQKCIVNGYLVPPEAQKQCMPGIPAGSKKTPFTEEDDQNLCNYLATVTPLEESGGRQAIGLYEEMVAKPKYDSTSNWVKRHSAESWRTHYKKHKKRFDDTIRKMVKHMEPDPKITYHRDRRLNGPQTVIEEDSDDANDAEERLARGEQVDKPVQARRNRSQARRRRVVQGKEPEDEDEEPEHQEETRHPQPEGDDRNSPLFSADEDEDVDEDEDYQLQYPDDLMSLNKPAAQPSSSQARQTSSSQAATSRKRPRPQALGASFRPPPSSVTMIGTQTSQPSSSRNRIPTSSPTRSARNNSDDELIPPTPSQESHPEIQPAASPPAQTLVPSTSSPSRLPLSQSQPAKPVRNQRQRSALPAHTDTTAPYRNTRARSRSVSVEPEQRAVAQRKKGRSRKKQPVPVAADFEPEEPGQEHAFAMHSPALERIVEAFERDSQTDSVQEVEEPVDDMVIDPVPPPATLLPRTSRKRERPLDIEDQQLRERFGYNDRGKPSFRNAGHVMHGVGSTRLSSARHRDPRAPSPSTRSNRSGVPPLGQNMTNLLTQLQSVAGPSNSAGTLNARSVAPDAVHSGGRPRGESESGSDEFPLKGTRAREARDKLKEQEKRTPYKPPAGTKAARLTRS